ncbi:hypothetical protein LP417_17395 [Polaromonas sp. P1-6]|nr:hypothetical protein LP417_17395 [Polaromonas sp. P1-6]
MNALTVAAACALCLAAGGSHAEPAPAVEASLSGHAALPATSAVQAPRDAGAFCHGRQICQRQAPAQGATGQ